MAGVEVSSRKAYDIRQRTDRGAGTQTPEEQDFVVPDPTALDVRSLAIGGAAVVLSITLLVLLLTSAWYAFNPALVVGDAPGVEGIPDEWTSIDRGELWERMEGSGWIAKTTMVYPFVGIALVGIAGLGAAFLALLQPASPTRDRVRVTLALVALLAAGLLAIGTGRFLAGTLVDLAEGNEGVRYGWALWVSLVAGLTVAGGAAWWAWRDHRVRPGLRVALVGLGALFLVGVLPAGSIAFPGFDATTDDRMFSLTAVHAFKEFIAEDAHDTVLSLYVVAAGFLWAGVVIGLGLALWSLYGGPNTSAHWPLTTTAYGLVILLALTGLILAVISFAQSFGLDNGGPSYGYAAFLAFPALGTLAVLEWRRDAAPLQEFLLAEEVLVAKAAKVETLEL